MNFKPWTSIDEQISILGSRGLKDAYEYRDYLSEISYYRLSGYSYPMRKFDLSLDRSHRRLDEFVPEATMRDVIELYEFDENLRLSVWKAICKLEIGFRNDVGRILGKNDPLIHTHFCENWPYGKMHSRAVEFGRKLKKNQELSSEEFVKHHKKFYGNKMPIWVVTEILEFGQLVTLFSLAPVEDRLRIADIYGVRGDELESWLRVMNLIRNICAHHGRLWNRNLVARPLTKHQSEDSLLGPCLRKTNKSFSALSILVFLLEAKGFRAEQRGIKDTLKGLPADIPCCPLSAAGVPRGWDQLPLWRRIGS